MTVAELIEALKQSPTHTVIVRAPRELGGFCLYYKVLEKGRFSWPSPSDGTATADGTDRVQSACLFKAPSSLK